MYLSPKLSNLQLLLYLVLSKFLPTQDYFEENLRHVTLFHL